MTKLIAYHKDSKYLAIFESDGCLWVGQYDQYLTHQTSEAPYVFLFSCFSIDRGIEKMNSLNPNLMH